MKKNEITRPLLFGSIFLLLFLGCKKDNPTPVSPTTSTPTTKVAPTTKTVSKTVISKDTLKVGTGSGSLLLDGSINSIPKNPIIIIKGGSYSSITFQNLHGTDSTPISIVNNGLVELTGKFSSITLNNVSNISLNGNGTPSIKKGFYLHDNAARALTIQGTARNISIQNLNFKNIGDYSIYAINNQVYNGLDTTVYKNFTVSSCTFNNCGGITFGGAISGGVITGLTRNLVMAQDTFLNTDWGSVVFAGACDGYDIHDNYFNNINLNNIHHNAMFLIIGNGNYYRNFVGNHQGMSLRAWLVAFSTSPKTELIYNNITLNSLKYSSFEVQSFSTYMIPGQTTFCNAYIFQNTSGNLNSNHDWFSNTVDIYDLLGGTVRLDNNLGFNFYPTPTTGLSYNSLAPCNPRQNGNLYFNAATDAGFDPINKIMSSNSPAIAMGTPDSIQVTDYYNKPRNPNHPTVGAIE